MSKQYTYKQIAEKFELWGEYVDTEATMTKEDFDNLSTDEKVEMQIDMFGNEETSDDDE